MAKRIITDSDRVRLHTKLAELNHRIQHERFITKGSDYSPELKGAVKAWVIGWASVAKIGGAVIWICGIATMVEVLIR